MTHEEMEKAVEFILSQQARFTENMLVLGQRMNGYEGRLKRIEESLEKVTGLVGEIAVAQARTEVKVAQLAEKVDQLAGSVDQIAGRVEQIAEKLAETDDRLNTLIVIVERFISKRSNGEQGQ